MNPGVKQGFVRFNSVAYHILKQLHENGPMTGGELARAAAHSEQVQISATIIRLRKARMVFIVGRHRPSGKRSHPVYGLERVNNLFGPSILTPAEKERLRRQRQKIKVPSVFQFRGQISL